MLGAAAMEQANARVDQHLKAAGDAILEQMDISPTQLIRAIWAKVARGARSCDQPVSVLAGDPAANAPVFPEEGTSERRTRTDWLEARQGQLARELGMDLATFVPHTDEQLEELMLADFFAGEGGMRA